MCYRLPDSEIGVIMSGRTTYVNPALCKVYEHYEIGGQRGVDECVHPLHLRSRKKTALKRRTQADTMETGVDDQSRAFSTRAIASSATEVVPRYIIGYCSNRCRGYRTMEPRSNRVKVEINKRLSMLSQ